METTISKPCEFSVESHGVESNQYFQGAGVAYTQWDACYTGCGQTEKEAFEDALENASQDEWDTSEIETEYGHKMDDDETVIDVLEIESEDDAESCDSYFYVTIYVKG